VAVNSIYASIIPSYKYNLVLKSFSYGTLVMGHPVQNEGNKNIQFLRFLFKKVFRFIKLHSTGTARQNEGGTNGNSILQIPRNIVVIDEYY
jgi:hypothetical protein